MLKIKGSRIYTQIINIVSKCEIVGLFNKTPNTNYIKVQ